MYLEIIAPCFNEKNLIEQFVKDLDDSLSAVNLKKYIITIVDDGSSDGTTDILSNLAKNLEHLRVIILNKNYGHQSAILAGLENVHPQATHILTMDSDYQDPIADVLKMIDLIENNKVEIVFASRLSRNFDSYFKKITASLIYKYTEIGDFRFQNIGDFKIFTKKVLLSFYQLQEKQKYLRGIFMWMGYDFLVHKYDRPERKSGETKYTLSKMIDLGIRAIFDFSNIPLKLIVSITSIILFLFILFAVYVFYSFMVGETIQGWSSLAILEVFTSSLILISVNVLLIYIIKIYNQVKNRPEYIVKNFLNKNDD